MPLSLIEKSGSITSGRAVTPSASQGRKGRLMVLIAMQASSSDASVIAPGTPTDTDGNTWTLATSTSATGTVSWAYAWYTYQLAGAVTSADTISITTAAGSTANPLVYWLVEIDNAVFRSASGSSSVVSYTRSIGNSTGREKGEVILGACAVGQNNVVYPISQVLDADNTSGSWVTVINGLGGTGGTLSNAYQAQYKVTTSTSSFNYDPAGDSNTGATFNLSAVVVRCQEDTDFRSAVGGRQAVNRSSFF